MEPNINNQTSPIQQQPVATSMPPSPVQTASAPQAPNPVVSPQQPNTASIPPSKPRKGMGKGIILIILIAILMAGVIGYIIFAQEKLLSPQSQPASSTIKVIPTSTPTPGVPAVVEELILEDPEVDLGSLDEELTGL